MKTKINYSVIFWIIIASVILGITYNYFSVDGIDFLRKPTVIKNINDFEESDSTSIIGIDLAQAVNFYNTNAAVFVDARDQWDFSETHIAGAINIPEFSFEPKDSILSGFSKHQIFVLYCNGDDCDISKRLAMKFKKLGFINTFVFLGGIFEWEETGLPVEKGKSDE